MHLLSFALIVSFPGHVFPCFLPTPLRSCNKRVRWKEIDSIVKLYYGWKRKLPNDKDSEVPTASVWVFRTGWIEVKSVQISEGS